jgi:hypothetical protein
MHRQMLKGQIFTGYQNVNVTVASFIFVFFEVVIEIKNENHKKIMSTVGFEPTPGRSRIRTLSRDLFSTSLHLSLTP